MKQLFRSLIAISLAGTLFSCSPTVDNGAEPNSLNTLKSKSGTLSPANSNSYNIGLQCGCPFPMKVESADTMHISYDIKNLGDTISVHVVKATAKSGFAKGTYIDSIILVTI